jgi:hypothetical protein
MSEPPRAPADRLFAIQCPEVYEFQAGWSSQGDQVLMGLVEDGVVAVFFSASGRFLRYEFRPVKPEPVPSQSPVKQEQARDALLWSALGDWTDELGLTRGVIKVFPFWVGQWVIGIAGLPDFWVRFLSNPQSENERRRVQWFKEIEEWQREGKYILWWRSEYWMDKEGHVFAT